MFIAKILPSIIDAPPQLFRDTDSPFMSLAFWRALEDCGAVSPDRGWWARHVLLCDEHDEPLALMPLFAKNHNRGEYVFDHAWAHAYAENGLEYYPRLVTSVPFTPVVGERVWLAVGVELSEVAPALFNAAQAIAKEINASSWHGLFFDEPSIAVLEQQLGSVLAIRHNCQFLWVDDGYVNFDVFLNALTTKRRKNIRNERRKIALSGITCRFIEGADISPDDWTFFTRCYARTYAVRGQKPYLSQAFFERIGRDMPQSLVLEIASDNMGEPIAAALFFKDATTLYGRYWGAVLDVDCLHFEVCYYQGIEYALRHGLSRFDPGTQGEHKLTRGFAPIYTQSVHWLAHSGFMGAVKDFVAREKIGIDDYYQSALEALPYKKPLYEA